MELFATLSCRDLNPVGFNGLFVHSVLDVVQEFTNLFLGSG